VPITIKVRNNSSKPIQLAADDGRLMKVDQNKEVAVDLDVVRAPAFAEQLASGAIALTGEGLDKLGASERADAATAVADAVLRAAPRFEAHLDQMRAAMSRLSDLKEMYNQQHRTAVALLKGAKPLVAGAGAAVDAANTFGALMEEDRVVKRTKDAIDAHYTEVPKDSAALKAWYDQHRDLEAKLADAIQARDTARSVVILRLGTTADRLQEARVAFGDADPDTIGPPVSWKV
jgi:hypothetical protein